MRYQLTWESFPYFPINSYNPNNNSETKFENSEFSLKNEEYLSNSARFDSVDISIC